MCQNCSTGVNPIKPFWPKLHQNDESHGKIQLCCNLGPNGFIGLTPRQSLLNWILN